MNETMNRLLFWIPRIAALGFAGFLAIFALDAFSGHGGPSQLAVALTMHLIPPIAVLGALALAWRHEWIGAILFPLLAVSHLGSAWGRFEWSAYAIIEGPLLLLGILFWINWRARVRRRPGPAA